MSIVFVSDIMHLALRSRLFSEYVTDIFLFWQCYSRVRETLLLLPKSSEEEKEESERNWHGQFNALLSKGDDDAAATMKYILRREREREN